MPVWLLSGKVRNKIPVDVSSCCHVPGIKDIVVNDKPANVDDTDGVRPPPPWVFVFLRAESFDWALMVLRQIVHLKMAAKLTTWQDCRKQGETGKKVPIDNWIVDRLRSAWGLLAALGAV